MECWPVWNEGACSTQPVTTYEDWGKLQLGKSRIEVLQLLSEPYITQEGFINGGGVPVERIIFGLRVKHYVIGESASTTVKTNMFGVALDSAKSLAREHQRKPEKSAYTSVWGDYVHLLWTFERGKLVHWISRKPNGTVDTPMDSIEQFDNAVMR